MLAGREKGKGRTSGVGQALDLLPPALISQSDGTFEARGGNIRGSIYVMCEALREELVFRALISCRRTRQLGGKATHYGLKQRHQPKTIGRMFTDGCDHGP